MKNELILITGGSGKLGKVMLKKLLNLGYKVITTCSSKSSYNSLKKEFFKYSNKLKIFQIDFLKNSECENFVLTLNNKNLLPTILVNNARSMNFLKVNKNEFSCKEDFLGEYQMDVFVPYHLSFLLANHKKSPLKKIINIGSKYGIVASNPNLYKDKHNKLPIQYALAKSALHHLTKELAIRFAGKNISVNCIAFGGVAGREDCDFEKRYAKLSPLKRMLKETEIPGALNFLISDDSSGITGHVLVVDGGWSIW